MSFSIVGIEWTTIDTLAKRKLRIEKPHDPAGLTVEAWAQV